MSTEADHLYHSKPVLDDTDYLELAAQAITTFHAAIKSNNQVPCIL